MASDGRLTRKLILAFLFVALVPLGLLAAFGPRIVRSHFEALSRNRIAGVLAAVGRDLDLARETIRVAVTDLTTDPGIVRSLALSGGSGAPELSLIDEIVERRTALDLDWLEVTGPDGMVLARGHDRGTFGIPLASDPLVAAALAGQPLAAVVELAPPDSGLALLAAAPVVFENRVLGVVRGGTLLDRRFLGRLHDLSGAELAILSPAGRTIATTFAAGADSTALARAAVAPPDSTVEIVLGGEPYRLGGLPLGGIAGQPSGALAVGVSEADLDRTLESLLRLLGGAALIALLVSIGMALIFASRVSRPVRALAHAARRVSHGDLAVRLPVGPSDEVGDLMAAFNAMAVDLAGSRERLARSERQAAWAQVARRLAHEIKNPLTPIQLAIEEVERARERGDADLDEVITRAARTIKAEVRVLRELVREFNDFARSPQPRPESVDLPELLDRAIELYAPSGVEVQRDYAPSAERLVADPDLLVRAFGNLVKNACEAMGGQGTLAVSTRAGEGRVAVTIADSGPGIAPADRERIFTPYFTTKPEGTGLGLAIVRRVVEDHGGGLELLDEGPGARFRVHLPLAGPGAPGARGGGGGEPRG